MHGETPKATRPHLSKTRVVAGWKCPGYLWWKVHRPDADELQPSVADEDRMDQGTAFGELATDEFPGGILIDLPYDQMHEKVEMTREALATGAPAIFEASFWEDEVFVAVDILEQHGDAFHLIEVKATTRVKEEHIPDAAVQLHVLRRAGLPVDRVSLMHLNPEYRHPGPESLFTLSNITADVKAFLPEVPGLIQSCHDVLGSEDPGPEIGVPCTRFRPHCPLDGICWPQEPDHIRRLAGVGIKTALRYMDDGVHTFGDLPPGARLGEKAQRQLESWRTGEVKVEPTLMNDLEPFRGRVGFLDFETVMRAVPVWDGLAPWGMVPVQFSYHERQSDGSYAHQEWLAEGSGDPRRKCAEELLKATKNAERVGTYTGYEERCINVLKDAVPDLAPQLDDLISRLVDLKKVLEKNVAHPDFQGSYSIKDVLTPLVPTLSYEGMEVADGMTASVRLFRMMMEGDAMPSDEYQAERRALLDYCELDTQAMVELYEAMEGLVGGGGFRRSIRHP